MRPVLAAERRLRGLAPPPLAAPTAADWYSPRGTGSAHGALRVLNGGDDARLRPSEQLQTNAHHSEGSHTNH